jgi:hypothetical protein
VGTRIEVQRVTYLNELINRIKDEPTHLGTFSNFIDFCKKIKCEINNCKQGIQADW